MKVNVAVFLVAVLGTCSPRSSKRAGLTEVLSVTVFGPVLVTTVGFATWRPAGTLMLAASNMMLFFVVLVSVIVAC